MTTLPFALNHMTAPRLSVGGLFDLAASLDLSGVEIRNDLAGNAILDGTSPAEIRALAEAHGITILSINALQRFNAWNDVRADEARSLIDYARDCGARALVLVPVNDGTGQADGERQANLVRSLAALKPMLEDADIVGLVEPLGFTVCSLRSKTEALEGILAVDGAGTFKLVHDTFHHHLAGEEKFHSEHTGLVHISGVADTDVAVDDLRDGHRVLVDGSDRLGNAAQIARLIAEGYAGSFSFEPFSAAVHDLSDPETALKASMAYVTAAV